MSPALHRLRSRAGSLAVAAVVALPVALTTAGSPAHGDQTYYVPVTKSWTVTGHGFGHGHGMSQYGAQGAALRGLDYKQIVDFYYPGTSWAGAKGLVRVLISADTTSDLQVRPQTDLRVRDLADGRTWVLPDKSGVDVWRLTPRKTRTAVQFHDARGWHNWRVPHRGTFAGAAEFAATGNLTLLVPSGSSVRPLRYRGVLRSVPPHKGATVRDTVNVLTMDSYVRGVVPYEMPASWEPQALAAQAVAARTYAAWQRAQNPGRYYQICDTTACQVYGGVNAEQASSNAAVKASARKILTYHGKPAFTQFSASSGGWTSDGGVPYLPAQRDPYDGFPGNGVHTWKVTVSTGSLERAYPQIGSLQDVQVTSRDGHGVWGGRVQQLRLNGSRGSVSITGDDFRWRYGLHSSWFSIAPTPIIERWRHLGGGQARIGNPDSGEYAVRDGSAQNFTRGRIWWSPSTGAREMMGGLLRTYRKLGGPSSVLGWPRTGILQAPHKGRKIKLQGGYLYARAGVGAHALFGPILRHWATKENGPRGRLGYPTSNVTHVSAGQRATFEHGSITWVKATNRFRVHVSG